MKIFKIENHNSINQTSFEAKKITKPAEKFISEQPSKLLSAAMASIGLAGIALNTEASNKKYNCKTDRIDMDFFMQVYNSEGTIHEKSKKLGINHNTYRKMVDDLGLEFKPAVRGTKPQYGFSKEVFEEVYYSKMPLKEKLEKLGLTNSSMLYVYANKFGLKKQKINNMSEEEFKKVFNMDIPLKEKCEILGISESSYYKLVEKFDCITTRKFVKTITKEQFEKVYNQDTTLSEKCKILGIARGTYITLAEKFGFPVEITPASYIKSADIPTEKFISVYNENITVAEKCEKLGISRQTYIKRAKELGLKPRKTFFTGVDLSKITLEDFLKVYNDKTLTINQKCLKLGIGEYSYFKLVRKWNLHRGKGVKG